MALQNLPNDALLATATTDDQREFWSKKKNRMNLISRCWKARVNGCEDPLADLVEMGTLDPLIYQALWLLVDKWWAMWGLIQLSYKFVRREAQRKKLTFPFQSSQELLLHIIEAELEQEWSVCMEDLHIFHSSHAASIGRLTKKLSQSELTLEEHKTLFTLLKNSRSLHRVRLEGVHWASFIFEVCYKKATSGNELIDFKLGEMERISCQLHHLAGRAVDKRYSQTWNPDIVRSWAWVNGNREMLKNGRLLLQNRYKAGTIPKTKN